MNEEEERKAKLDEMRKEALEKQREEKKVFLENLYKKIKKLMVFELLVDGQREYQRVPGGLLITITKGDKHQSYETETHNGGFQNAKNIKTTMVLEMNTQFIPMENWYGR